MTLNQILYFQKVARLENYHQAAEELYISQPSLSRSMAALESELGVALFEKKGRGVTLTKAGKLFLEHADRIAGDCDVAVGKMQELSSDGGKIDIGYIFPLAGHYIPHKVRKFLNQEENKNVVFNFWQNHTPAIARRFVQASWTLVSAVISRWMIWSFSAQRTGAGDHHAEGTSPFRDAGSSAGGTGPLPGDRL